MGLFFMCGPCRAQEQLLREIFFDGTIDSVFSVRNSYNERVEQLQSSFQLIEYFIIRGKKRRLRLTGRGMLEVKYDGILAGGGVSCVYKGDYIGEIEVSGKVRKGENKDDLIANVSFAQVPRIELVKAQCSAAGHTFEIDVDEPALRVTHRLKNVIVRTTFHVPLTPRTLESQVTSRDPRGIWESSLRTRHMP